MVLQDGQPVECSIRSLNGNPCNVRYGSQTMDLNLKAGESRKLVVSDFWVLHRNLW